MLSERRRSAPLRLRRLHLFRLGGKVFARVDEPVVLETILRVVEHTIPARGGEQLGVNEVEEPAAEHDLGFAHGVVSGHPGLGEVAGQVPLPHVFVGRVFAARDAILGSIANTLGAHFEYAVPELVDATIENLLSTRTTASDLEILVADTCVHLNLLEIEIVLVLGLSVEELGIALDSELVSR